MSNPRNRNQNPEGDLTEELGEEKINDMQKSPSQRNGSTLDFNKTQKSVHSPKVFINTPNRGLQKPTARRPQQANQDNLAQDESSSSKPSRGK